MHAFLVDGHFVSQTVLLRLLLFEQANRGAKKPSSSERLAVKTGDTEHQ